jgi:hypothetical protein
VCVCVCVCVCVYRRMRTHTQHMQQYADTYIETGGLE